MPREDDIENDKEQFVLGLIALFKTIFIHTS